MLSAAASNVSLTLNKMSLVLNTLAKTALAAVFAALLFQTVSAQTAGKPKKTRSKAVVAGPVVTRVDAVTLNELLKPKGKPLLVNFWATWCDSCREEFPDLVRIDTAYRGKIDFITVSLDDLAEIKTSVPKFLAKVKAAMPAYLLKTTDDDAAITMVSKAWKGGLPFTMLIHPDGEVGFLTNRPIKYEILAAEIDEALAITAAPAVP